jgi:hypothetical protein
MSEKRSWYASGKERKPGNLLKYTFIVLTGVVFATVAILLLLVDRGNVGMSLLWSAIAAVITAVIGVIVYFVYIKFLVKK